MARIVWDIDGVMIDLKKYLLEKAPCFFKEKYQKEIINCKTIDLKEMFNCSEIEEKSFWATKLNLLTYSLLQKPRYGLKEVMDAVASNGDENIICTARAKCDEDSAIGKIMRWSVYTWIKKNKLPITSVHFVSYKNSVKEKLEYCQKINATVIVEDDSKNIKTLSHQIPTIIYQTDYNVSLKGKNIYPITNFDELYLQVEKIKKNKDFSNFRFLSKEERERLSYEELKVYYDKYREVMRKMPYDYKLRKQQEEKYNRLYNLMNKIHSKISSKATVLNQEMIEMLKFNYQEGKVFIIASHKTLDDIQQVEATLNSMSYFLVKNEFFKYPFIGKFLYSIGCIYVERNNKESRKYARSQLEKLVLHDKNIIVLPEGTRNKTDKVIRPFEKGAMSIAQKTGSYLVPIVIKRYDDSRKEVFLKICTPRKVAIDANINTVTSQLEEEMTREILDIQEKTFY